MRGGFQGCVVTEVFGASYAHEYDLFYRDKDYDGEVALVQRAIATHLGRAERIVDFGCGSGAHAIRLAARGYEVTGIDRSEAMLELARAKGGAAVPATFMLGDVRDVRINKVFDAALMMFAVLGYQHTNADVRAALATARAHLMPGGLFIADVWYGPAVLATRPESRTRTVSDGERTVTRHAQPTLDTFAQLVTVHYDIQVALGGKVEREFEETHTMRYFFAQELLLLLEDSGFTALELRSALHDGAPPTDATWNVLIVARAS